MRKETKDKMLKLEVQEEILALFGHAQNDNLRF